MASYQIDQEASSARIRPGSLGPMRLVSKGQVLVAKLVRWTEEETSTSVRFSWRVKPFVVGRDQFWVGSTQSAGDMEVDHCQSGQ
jgi:hypothetical protein